jgi:exodeoxyribonuclease VII large subunit
MSFMITGQQKNRILRVAELNLAIKQLIESEVPLLWVRGEISNLVKAASGHYYFSLKDELAQVRCVMFRHKNQYIERPVSNGQSVEVLASATLYEQRGDFQLTVEQLRPAGLGVLFEQFEQLKQLLASEGLFANERKRVLPRYPRRIGVVTSPQAAALRDVLTTLKLRLPSVPVVLYPTPVQGQGSAEKIVQAIATANQRAECDVLIVCRGGGSIEDLWAFNEEVVARAIAGSTLPVVSGVGHETDFTIADFVADLRAPTPTAAAQAVVPDRLALLLSLRDTMQHLHRAMRNRLHNAMQNLDYLQRRVVHPDQQLQRQQQQLQELHGRLQRAEMYRKQRQNWQWQAGLQRLTASGAVFIRQGERHTRLAERFALAMRTRHDQQVTRLENVAQQLVLLDPQKVLARGYSLVHNREGNLLSDAQQVEMGDELRITFAHGWGKVELKEKGHSS